MKSKLLNNGNKSKSDPKRAGKRDANTLALFVAFLLGGLPLNRDAVVSSETFSDLFRLKPVAPLPWLPGDIARADASVRRDGGLDGLNS